MCTSTRLLLHIFSQLHATIEFHKKLCNNVWATESNLSTMSARCIKPSYVAYKYDSGTKFVYRCSDNFLDSNTSTMSISDLKNQVISHCTDENWEIIMPYVDSFHLSVPTVIVPNEGTVRTPELLIDYTIKREFVGDIPPVYFKFKRSLTRKRGV